jgi:hypothetical protein
MNSIPQTQIQDETLNEFKQPHKGVVLSFDSALRNSKRHSQFCIFCKSPVQTQTFKGKIVCSSCLEHIPSLFMPKQLQLV